MNKENLSAFILKNEKKITKYFNEVKKLCFVLKI